MSYSVRDYPIAEKHPDKVRGAHGKSLNDITLDAVLAGDVSIEDLRITPEALDAQADVARDAGRPRLADNFQRAAELVAVPQEKIMRAYELLRPGRARSKEELLAVAEDFETTHGARRIAGFIREAAGVYEARGLFTKRY
ncbi:MAG: glycerol dehydratase [Rhizobiales bacterium]|nr:glycerol dehydratase [Hyphomicrobiales bacterium]